MDWHGRDGVAVAFSPAGSPALGGDPASCLWFFSRSVSPHDIIGSIVMTWLGVGPVVLRTRNG